MIPTVNVQVEKTANENTLGLLRRFTKRVQGSGVLNRIRKIRYKTRNASTYTRKKHALKALRRKEEVLKLIKLGKMADNIKR
jgi:hypothetical protein